MTLTAELARWAAGVEMPDVPARIVGYAKSQLLSQLAAARGGLAHPLGAAVTRTFGPLLQADPKQSSCALAAMTAWLHFDDTAYAGHISHSTVNVPVAWAWATGLDGSALLRSIIVANECAARVAAATTLSEFRGQAAAYTHLAGSVSGRLSAENAPAPVWVDAFGLAFSMPPWTLYHAFLGSDGKILSASTPVRIGLDACDCARAGLHGAPDILEHPQGFLARFAQVPLPATITAGLGRRWHTETLSFKMHPAGPGVDAAVDCALALHTALGGVDVGDIADVTVRASSYTAALDAHIAPYMDGPDSPIGALTFSIGYTVATALLTGNLEVADFALPRLGDPDRWALAAKVRVELDPEMTRRFRLAEIPLGEALREAGRDAAARWLASTGAASVDEETLDAIARPSETFETATKATPTVLTVRLTGGRTVERACDIPLGAAGADTRARHPELVRAKFLATGGDPTVADGIAALENATAADVRRLLTAALDGDRALLGADLAA